MGVLQEKADAEGLKPTKYVLGDEEEDGHIHEIYLRDHLPIATTTNDFHAHSIEEGPDKTLVCRPGPDDGHTHTKLVIAEAGNYTARTLHI